MKKVVRRAAIATGAAAAVGAGVAAARRPEARSVISRVVEQVKDRATNLGATVSSKMPGSSSPSGSTGSSTSGSTGSNWNTGGGSNYGDEDEM